MANERKLLVRILGDASGVQKAFHEAGGGVEGFAGVLDKYKGKLEAALSVGAIADFAKDTVKSFSDAAGEVAKLQRLTGGTAEDMSRLAFQAKETGVGNDILEMALKKVSTAMVGNNKLFGEYGIATRDAKGNLLPLNDVMQNAADVFSKMANGAEKNNLAVKLFGKSGLEMLPMLNRGRDGLKELSDESDRFGVTIGQDGVDAYRKNLIAGREMHAAMEGLKIQIGEKLMPVIANITSWLAENLPKAIAFVKGVMEDLQPTFKAIGTWIATLVVWWQDHWDSISDKVTKVLGYIQGAIDTAVAAFELIWRNFGSAILQYLKGAWDAIAGVFQGAFQVIDGLFQFFRDLFTGKWGKLWGDVKLVLDGIWTAIKGVVKGALETLGAILDVAWTAIKLAAGVAWGLVKDAIMFPIGLASAALKTVWGDIKSAAETAFNAVKAVIEPIIRAIAAIIQTIIDKAQAAIDILKKVKDFAVGGAADSINAQLHAKGVPGYAGGGVTPGSIDQIAGFVHGNEIVLNPGQQASLWNLISNPGSRQNARGGDTIQVFVAGSVVTQNDITEATYQGLLRKKQRQGALGLT